MKGFDCPPDQRNVLGRMQKAGWYTGDRFTFATVNGLSVRYVVVYHRVPRPPGWSGGCTAECIFYRCLFTVVKVKQSPVLTKTEQSDSAVLAGTDKADGSHVLFDTEQRVFRRAGLK